MTTLPWIAVATILVPLYLLTHFTIAARLRSAEMMNLPKQEPAAAGRKRQWPPRYRFTSLRPLANGDERCADREG
jgi:hypothetical protein